METAPPRDGRSADWPARLAAARAAPNTWVVLDGEYSAATSTNIINGRYQGIEPGEYEATTRVGSRPGRRTVWVRYIAGRSWDDTFDALDAWLRDLKPGTYRAVDLLASFQVIDPDMSKYRFGEFLAERKLTRTRQRWPDGSRPICWTKP